MNKGIILPLKIKPNLLVDIATLIILLAALCNILMTSEISYYFLSLAVISLPFLAGIILGEYLANKFNLYWVKNISIVISFAIGLTLFAVINI